VLAGEVWLPFGPSINFQDQKGKSRRFRRSVVGDVMAGVRMFSGGASRKGRKMEGKPASQLRTAISPLGD